MSKQVRWQVPFADINGNRYRVDIYDEGYSGNPVVLKAGDTPFTTKEDDSDDFFAPIRTQTGTLQICTKIPGSGTPLKLEDLLPANNIARPVRLNRINSSGTVLAIEWQGFLSCEAYSQAYVSTPENISFPVISVLEAMDSVEVELSENMAFKKILGHAAYAMKAIETKSGMTIFDQVYIASYVKTALTTQYFYNNVYFSTEEQISGDNVVIDVHSISCKKILEQIATFFGCCWREKGQNIYLQAIGQSSYQFHSFTSIYNTYVEESTGIMWLSAQDTTANLSDSDWMGNNHKRSVVQGMRRVKVSSKLDDFGCKMALEETPVNNLVENPDARQSTWGEVHCNTNETFYSLATHKHRRASVKVELDSSYTYGKKATMNMGTAVSGINYTNTWPWSSDDYLTNYYGLFMDVEGDTLVGTVNHYVTSYMAWVRLTKEEENESHGHDTELVSGLMVCALPSSYRFSDLQQYIGIVWPSFSSDQYIFKQTTATIFAASKGKFTFNVEWGAFTTQEKMYNTWEKKSGLNEARGLTMAIQWGNKWLQYDGNYAWVDSFTTFNMVEVLKDGKFEGKPYMDIPISSFNAGLVSVYIFPKVTGNTAGVDMRGNVHNLFITRLELSYEAPTEELRTDRSENVYATETSQAFRDELSLDVDLASYANNTKLATMLWNDATTPAKLISLGGATVRPEVNLLNRLAAYYGAARQRLELEVEHPTNAPLPLLKLNGINDGKVYLPLSEQRNWRTNECKLICMENPS